jgi:hypothetical protein
LVSAGYQIILIDEITNTECVLDSVMALPDEINAKVVIAGTSSLLIHWAMGGALFGRVVTVSTTGMRYAEYIRLFENANIDEFMRSGGVLWDENEPRSVKAYLETSVVENITHSLGMLEDWQNPSEKNTLSQIDSGELFNILEAICECRVYDAIERRLRKNWGKGVAWRLTMAHTHRDVGGLKSDAELQKVKGWLHDYFIRVPVSPYEEKTAVIGVLTNRLRDMGFLTDVMEVQENFVHEKQLMITQPYVKRDFVRRTLSVLNENGSLGLDNTIAKMESITDGLILEDIVYLEARARYADMDDDGANVFRYKAGFSEIDVCVYQKESGKLDLYEVKLSAEKSKAAWEKNNTGQDSHLINTRFIAGLTRYIEPISVTKTVLYKGPTDAGPDENSVRWVNLEEWLLGEVEV